MFMTFWRCGRATKTYVLRRWNLALRTSRWPPWDTFRARKRSSKHCSHSWTWRCGCVQIVQRSPLPPPLPAKDLPGGLTQVLNVCWIRRINRHPVESDEDSAPESISDTEDWLDCNGDLNNPNDSEDNCVAEVESDIEQGNRIEDPECPEQQDVSTAPTVPGLIRPTQKSKRQAEKVLMMVNAIETRMNMGMN